MKPVTFSCFIIDNIYRIIDVNNYLLVSKNKGKLMNGIAKNELNKLLERNPSLSSIQESIESSFELLLATIQNGNKILICGNGGSASDADHIVGELMKSFKKKRPLGAQLKESLENIDLEKGSYLSAHLQDTIPAINLTQHTALSTAFANDVDPDLSYAQQVLGYGKPGDLLWAISTSGNAKNVLYASVVAKAKGLPVLGMTGYSGGGLKQYCDTIICAPERETYLVQELHLPIYHFICSMLEEILW